MVIQNLVQAALAADGDAILADGFIYVDEEGRVWLVDGVAHTVIDQFEVHPGDAVRDHCVDEVAYAVNVTRLQELLDLIRGEGYRG